MQSVSNGDLPKAKEPLDPWKMLLLQISLVDTNLSKHQVLRLKPELVLL
jgi:hypothetical protein